MGARLIVWTMLPFFVCGGAFAQQQAPKSGESHKYRTILTPVGGGGGFALGLVVGLAAFDDATNSDRKVWTTAVISGVAGAVGGYFLGRALDKRAKKTTVTWTPDQIDRNLLRSHWSALLATESPHSFQATKLKNSANRFLTRHRVGIDQPNQPLVPNWDVNSLYLAAKEGVLLAANRTGTPAR
jgi:hypothetical protein